MQRLNFGRIENLTVNDGEPLTVGSSTVAMFRFCGDNGSRPELELEDFVLPIELLEFIELVRALDSHSILQITVKHGLPFKMEVANLV